MTTDAFLADCRARLAFDLLSNTWNAVVIWALRDGPRRPVELRQRIGGISSKVLTETLRRLQFNGLVERQADPGAPSRVEYRLTALGRTLLAPIDAVGAWAFEHGDDVMAAQEAACRPSSLSTTSKPLSHPTDPGDEFSRPHPSHLRRGTTRRKDDVMSADTRLEELGVSGLGEVDESAFSGLAERHRRELHVHCYRMLGSFDDAEDTVQETFLRAWRRRETFEGRSTFRAWLYRIATNACLDLLAKRRPEPATGGEVLWLQPYPDRLLDELPAGDADEPETVAVARETIELAYLVAVQHLAPRPRAALILRDVVGWPAKDVAELLGDSVNSVNSALQRARAGMREHLPTERQDWTGSEEDAGTRELVRRYTDASVATDIPALAAMLRDDVRCSMPPTPGLYVGRDAVVNDWVESGFEGMKGLRAVLTSVNRQPAVAFYLWREQEGAYLPLTIDVLRVTGGAISEIVTFHDDQFPRLGVPERLPADGTE